VNLNKIYRYLAFLFLSMILIGFVSAPGEELPHRFYGSVTVNGEAAADGTSVVAKIDGTEVASTTTVEGKYILDIKEPKNKDGKTIEFFVKEKKATELVFEYVEEDTKTKVNLSVEIENPPSNPPSSGGGGSGGGG